MILADGTFECVLSGFSQLYIFHAIVRNNVSIPMFFCLVRRKTRRYYSKLITMVEEIAVSHKTRIFDRPVTLMCDFEWAFIDAVQSLFGSVRVKCCFFHFTKNIRTKGRPIVNAIKKAVGETSEAYRMAHRTKSRLMMLPLLPEELAIPEVLGLVHRAWTEACPQYLNAFDELVATVIGTYIGTPPGSECAATPRF